jgi:hypothetical protein
MGLSQNPDLTEAVSVHQGLNLTIAVSGMRTCAFLDAHCPISSTGIDEMENLCRIFIHIHIICLTLGLPFTNVGSSRFRMLFGFQKVNSSSSSTRSWASEFPQPADYALSLASQMVSKHVLVEANSIHTAAGSHSAGTEDHDRRQP